MPKKSTVLWTTAAVIAAAGLAVGAARTAAQQAKPQTDELVVVSWGGSYQEVQREAFFKPFAAATGIRLREDTGPQIERSRAEVQSGKPTFDITATNQTFYLIGLDQNLWTPIDYKYFDPADLKAMPEEVRKSHGVGTIYYSEGFGFNTKAFPDGRPQPASWADFWDAKKFPGKRALPKCNVAAWLTPEAATLAMGVAQDKIYPVDIKKAAEKVKELSEHVIFWDNVAQPGQMLASGEVVMAMGPGGRYQILIDQGAPLKIVWAGSRYTFDVWYVLKGAKNPDNAMRLIAFASKPEQQAIMAKKASYAPTNARAFDLIDKETARKLITYPENFKQAFAKNEVWWKENREKWVEVCTQTLLQ